MFAIIMKRRSLLLTLDMLDRLLEEIKYGCKRNRAVRCAIPATEAYCRLCAIPNAYVVKIHVSAV